MKISAERFNIEDARDKYDNDYWYLLSVSEDEIASFYRYVLGGNQVIYKNNDSDEIVGINTSTSEYYNFPSVFIRNFHSKSIELGRSVVNDKSLVMINDPQKNIGIDSIWRGGLGPLIYRYYKYPKNPHYKHFFGQFSLQEDNYPGKKGKQALIHIFALFIKNFGSFDNDQLFLPKENVEFLDELLSDYRDVYEGQYIKDRKKLRKVLLDLGMPEPKLALHYGNMDSRNEGHFNVFWPVYNKLLRSYEMANRMDFDGIPIGHQERFIGNIKDINLSAFDPLCW